MRIAAAVVLVASLAGEARAEAPAALIDADAQLVLAASPDDIGAALDSLAALGHGLFIGLARRWLESSVGWDLGDPRAWAARGFDRGGDIWISLAVDDGEPRYDALATAATWNDRTAATTPAAFWRLRVIARLTGGPARLRARSIAARLGGAIALGRNNVRARVVGPLLVVDIARPMFSGAGAAVTAAQVTARARPPRPGRHFARGAALAGTGLRGWMRAGAVIAVGRALQRELHIELQRDGSAPRGSGPWRPNPRCVELAALVDGRLFRELSWRLAPRGPTLELTFGGDAAAIAAAFPVAATKAPLRAHRLPDLTAAGALRIASFAGLRALPRTPVFRSFTDALAHVQGCEAHYGWTARLFGWPHLIGLFLDEIAALGPRGKTLAASVSGASIGVTSWNLDPLRMVAVLEGALDPAGIAPATELLDLAFGAGRGDRWGARRMRAYLRRGEAPVLGTSLGGERGARLAARRPGREWVDRASLAALRVDLDAAGGILRAWEPRLVVLGRARTLRLEVRPVPGGLRARIALSR